MSYKSNCNIKTYNNITCNSYLLAMFTFLLEYNIIDLFQLQSQWQIFQRLPFLGLTLLFFKPIQLAIQLYKCICACILLKFAPFINSYAYYSIMHMVCFCLPIILLFLQQSQPIPIAELDCLAIVTLYCLTHSYICMCGVLKLNLQLKMSIPSTVSFVLRFLCIVQLASYIAILLIRNYKQVSP